MQLPRTCSFFCFNLHHAVTRSRIPKKGSCSEFYLSMRSICGEYIVIFLMFYAWFPGIVRCCTTNAARKIYFFWRKSRTVEKHHSTKRFCNSVSAKSSPCLLKIVIRRPKLNYKSTTLPGSVASICPAPLVPAMQAFLPNLSIFRYAVIPLSLRND